MGVGRARGARRPLRVGLAALAAGSAVLAVAGGPTPSALATRLQVTPVPDSTTASALSLAQALAGPGVTVSNPTLDSAPNAAGRFQGGVNSVGLDSGVVLSSGSLAPADPQGCDNILLPPNTLGGT